MSKMLQNLAKAKQAEKETIGKLSGNNSEEKPAAEITTTSAPLAEEPVAAADALGRGTRERRPAKKGAIVIEPTDKTVEAYENLRIKSSSMSKLRKIKAHTGKPFYEIVDILLAHVDLSEYEK